MVTAAAMPSKNSFKFRLRYTGPFFRYEISNRAGIAVTADTMEKYANRFIASLRGEIAYARSLDRGATFSEAKIVRNEVIEKEMAACPS